jgi:phenylalanyl-tRNA synthetase beta chain
LEFSSVREELLHPVKATEVRANGERIGVLGEVHPHLTAAFDLPEAAIFEIDFEKFADLAQPWGKFTPIPIYPEVFEDYSFILPQTRSLADLIEKIRSSSPLVREVEIGDRFETKEGDRSITIKVTFQSEEKGLSSEDTTPVRGKIHQLISSNGGQLRS